MSIIAEQIDITETDFCWLDSHIKTVKHLARAYKISSARLQEEGFENFMQHFVQKMHLVTDKIINNIYIGHLPAGDIKIICNHYADIIYIMECVTGNTILLPSCNSLELLIQKFYISIRKVNKL